LFCERATGGATKGLPFTHQNSSATIGSRKRTCGSTSQWYWEHVIKSANDTEVIQKNEELGRIAKVLEFSNNWTVKIWTKDTF